MSSGTVARLAAVAEQRWGLVTTAQAAEVGVSRIQLSRLASAGVVHRVVQGVYRMGGAPELEHEAVCAAWLALGGAGAVADGRSVPGVVAGGITAAVLHGIGDFYPEGVEFIVPARKTTRLEGVRMRVRRLEVSEVAWREGMPLLTVECTLVDLVEQWVDLSLVGDALRDAVQQGLLTRPDRMVDQLGGLARARGHQPGDGQALAVELYEVAGLAVPW